MLTNKKSFLYIVATRKGIMATRNGAMTKREIGTGVARRREQETQQE
jgi:hypothetical protein